MSIRLQWQDNSKRGLVYTFPKYWTWDEFLACKLQADEWLTYLTDHTEDVALVFDLRASGPLPSNAFAVSRRVFGTSHPRGNPVIGVTDNQTIIGIVDVIGRFLPEASRGRLLMVRTLAEAEATVAAYLRRVA